MRNMIKPALILLIISFVVAFGISIVNYYTEGVIEERLRQTDNSQQREVLAEASDFKNISSEVDIMDQSQKDIINEIYAGYNDGKFVGFVFKNAVKGYGGDMNVTVGILASGEVSRVIIGQNNETPGLGSRVAESPFIEQYIGKNISKVLEIVKHKPNEDNQIEAVSGATISSKAANLAVSTSTSVAFKLLENGGY